MLKHIKFAPVSSKLSLCRPAHVQNAAFQMKNGKASGNDGINIELVKACGCNSLGDSRLQVQSVLNRQYPPEHSVLLHKKGDKKI